MWHVGNFDDHASAGRDPQGPQYARKICSSPAGVGFGQATRAGV